MASDTSGASGTRPRRPAGRPVQTFDQLAIEAWNGPLGVGRLRRCPLPSAVAYVLSAYMIGLGLYGSVAPSPLYQTYMELWDFSNLTLTLIYATYSFGVLATLLVAGRVSDDVGRRPVLLLSLGGLMASSLLFILAESALWLFVARGLQGIATGAVVGTASAAMLDFAGTRTPASVSRANAVSTTAGTGLGILTVALLVETDWAPRVLPYLVLLGLLAIAFIGAWWMPEAVEDRRRFKLRLEVPYVPHVVAGPFILASLAVVSSWTAGGLFFSLGPTLGARIFATTDIVVAVSGIVVLLAAAAIAQLIFGTSVIPWKATTIGSVALAVGIVIIAVSTELESGPGFTYLSGSFVAGLGFGLAFIGGLRHLVASIPAHHRASVMSAFYVVAYASLSIPAVIAGLLVSDLGLERTFQIFAAIVASIALGAAVVAWATRPRVV